MKSSNSSWGVLITLITTGLYFVNGLKEEVVTHPKSKQVNSGQLLTLPCIFNQNVSCIWMKNGSRVAIKGRYSMLSKNYKDDQPATANCSLGIESFTDSDIGLWKCATLAAPGKDATISKVANLTILKQKCLQCQKHPKTMKIKKGKKVTLVCKFNKNVICNWQKNGKVIKIVNRYKFKSKTPTSTKDCSIVITGAQNHDEGDWKCSSRANDNQDSVKCETAKLKIKED